ncbi:MAG: hypothetical protein IJN87_05915, partial [Firmicutes bacterium]|nr:hypothetical protein [Bacillota bacterium]
GGIGTLMYGNYHPFVHQNHIGDISDPYSYNGSRILAVRAAKPYYSGVMTQQIVDTEDAEELAFATDGLSNYIMAYLADSILHGVTDESWDAYVAGLEDYGHSFMIEWYNRKLNGEI